jgi:hypothetical protein
MTDVLKFVVELLEEEGFDLRRDYSGRGMYGKTCLGLVGDTRDLIRFIRFIEREHADEYTNFPMDDVDWLDDVREDSMGRSTIFYWPKVQVVSDDD